MSAPRKTRFAVLGLLSGGPLSGYDIKKLVEIGLSHFWSESYGQLYPTLESLVAEGLAEKRAEQGVGRRQRHIYSITEGGREVFAEWLAGPTEVPKMRSEFLLKFFLSGRDGADESLRLVREFRDQQAAVDEEYAASDAVLSAALARGDVPDELSDLIEADSRPQLLVFLLTLRQGLRVVEARLAWCDEAIEMLERELAETT